MKRDFLQSYLAAFNSIQGYFTSDAALLFMAYNQLIKSENISGDVLEIGVHHGLSAIALAALRGERKQFVAVDLFDEMQDQNVSKSGAGSRQAFLRNMKKFYDDIGFVRVIASASTRLRACDLGNGFSFCHVDGGHSPEETYHDLELCAEILMPGGLLALDDYFNPAFPGVCEGAVKFKYEQQEKLRPVAIGFNKVLFQKELVFDNLNAKFAVAFPHIPKTTSIMWETPVNHFSIGFAPFFDLDNPTAHALTPKSEPTTYAAFEPQREILAAQRGQEVTLQVCVTNKSEEAFPFGEDVFGLSYHLLANDETLLKYDNPRSYFTEPIAPGADKMIELNVKAPEEPGVYLLDIDLVWEHMMWLREKGNRTRLVKLVVS